MNQTRLIMGLMSGTSVDGIDAALVRVGRERGRYRVRVLAHVEHAWPRALRERLLAVMAPAAARTEEICALNFLVAREFAAAVEDLLKATRVGRGRIAAVASHGQTICHLPPEGAKKQEAESRTQEDGRGIGATLQIGDVSVLATLTGMRVVGNFRAADMAVGGQGAPLVPFADALLLADAKVARCVQNIGGIGNVTYLPAVRGSWSAAGLRNVIAFDTGPGNMLLDAVVRLVTDGRQSFDNGGHLAAAGALEHVLFQRLQRHPYFAARPPKSTGREMFGAAFAQTLVRQMENRKSKIENLLHTLTRLTAWSIGDAYRRFLPALPDEVILCGGGAENPVLVRMIGEELGPLRLRRIDEYGIPNKAKEAASFALLGAATLDGLAGNLPSVTGARRAVVLGEVADPCTR